MTTLDKEQQESIDRIESLPRRERRNLAKRMKKDMHLTFTPKISGKNKPYANHQTEENS